MSVELTMLAFAVTLLILLILIQTVAGILANTLPVQAGNRDHLPPTKIFHGRANRTVANHVEGLVMFAPLVLIGAAISVSTPLTVLGAQVFAYARLAHAVIYLLGLPWLRAVAWGAGMVGTAMVLAGVMGWA